MAGLELPGGMMPPASSSQSAGHAGAGGNLIFDTTTATFMADVIDASQTALVLVDFWAPWCGPCKQLTPTLEKVVTAAGGAVRLAKMDIDQHPEIPGQMGVQSIPAVFAFQNGRPVDGFAGAMPESEIRKFIERHAPDAFSAGESGLDAANAALEADDLQAAADLFSALLAKDANDVEARAGLIKVCVKSGDLDQAEAMIAELPADKAAHSSVVQASTMLSLARQAIAAGETAPLLEKVAANPNDHAARFDLAVALGAADDREGAVDHLLELFQRDREWNEQAAHVQLMQYFEAWGPLDPAVKSGRRRLSSLLFS